MPQTSGPNVERHEPTGWPSGTGDLTVPHATRRIAARLAAIFTADAETVRQLNDAHGRLREANDRLWSGVAPDAIGLIYDGAAPAGASEIAALASSTLPGSRDDQTALLQALQQLHWKIHHALCDYQGACEQRRKHAVDVGELSAELIATLAAAGWSPQQARGADVHALAAGEMRPAGSARS